MSDLTAARLREVVRYDPETGKFYWIDRPRSDFKTAQGYGSWRSRCLGKQAGSPTGHGYHVIGVDLERHYAHRLAWLYVYGEWPTQHVDHINGDGSDNRICNLRDVSNTDNHRNCRKFITNNSGVTGVRFTRYGTWSAAIWADAKIIRLGSFKTMDEAVTARRAAEERLGYHPNHGRAA